MNRAHRHPIPRRSLRAARRAFSLIEMIGVLALVGMFAAVITPNLAQSLSRSKGAKEDALLESIGAAVVDSVLANQIIPGGDDWATKVAAVSGLPRSEVQYVLPSDSTTARVYLVDPAFTPSTIGSISTSPLYTQSSSGASSVANTRVMILSVHKPGLSLPVTSGPAASASAFDNIWDWTLDPKTDAPPTGWPSTWTGNGEYLHVHRINFSPYFHRITFSNTQYPSELPYYQVGTGSANLIGTSIDAMFLQGTFIRVYADNEESSTPGDLQISHTIRESDNFIYASDLWQLH